jgi:penicillin-binding protein A
VTLQGFVPAEPDGSTPTPVPEPTAIPENALVRNVLGQGQQAISPLNMALIAAAVGNDGNAPVPRTLLAIRPRGADWQPALVDNMSRPYVASSAAQRLTEFMTANMLSDVLVNPQPQYPLAGHAGIAYSGKGKTLSWFIGFATLPDATHVAVAIVLEDINDPRAAAQIGQKILIAAYEQQVGSAPAATAVATESP